MVSAEGLAGDNSEGLVGGFFLGLPTLRFLDLKDDAQWVEMSTGILKALLSCWGKKFLMEICLDDMTSLK